MVRPITQQIEGEGEGFELDTIPGLTLEDVYNLGASSVEEDRPINNPPYRGANYYGVRPVGYRPTPSTIGVPGISAAGSRYDYQTNEQGLIGLDGRFLVDDNGDRYIYDAYEDGFNAYYSSTEEQRELVADMLRSKGQTIETIDDYVRGYQQLHQFANDAGISFDRAFMEYKQNAPDKPVAKGRSYRVSSAEDIKAVAKTVAYQTLGRGFTNTEADDFVKAYQQMQISSQQQSGVIEGAPDIGVAAEQFAEKVAPTEAQGIKFANHVAGFAKALKAV